MGIKRIVCSKCGKENRMRGGASILKHKEDYLCGLCQPKRFDDKILNGIILDFLSGRWREKR